MSNKRLLAAAAVAASLALGPIQASAQESTNTATSALSGLSSMLMPQSLSAFFNTPQPSGMLNMAQPG
ncbi:MAG: hypothetical protein HOE99_08055, partial [Acidiferrobacteraceae bacterium]|nr:hypothetical protein [Acidiferrobacteraceae bacterium]